MNLSELLNEASKEMNRRNNEKKASIEEIKDFITRLNQKPERPFKYGDIVTWKDGMKNRRFPDYDERGVISEVLDTPIPCPDDTGSQYYMEPQDVKVVVFRDGEFCEYMFDSRRLRHADN
ncbi:hypothetical protein LB105_003640 [Salmonella enterica]|uniref:Uncharacterized protein n=4 Tax=Salmonella enterica TaxID=28901 RepID=A0A5X8XVW1_SALNE|nr:hypothetical protein [Salmonella enterica subsp. enterica serovar Rubislaw]EAB1499807.1 hypothetical protein [Salmonella enterica]EAB6208815.1 hypothetical protein [Salmonella enterica subsp. enterica serovar Agbeni]EBF6639548.1 hypothetical protein [Salmonella enterica subsp. enterica serovar Reading]EBQ4756816.1 hypothetical protein [Salmonella enterica subsp. diarizonae]EBR9314845.1 hypothetical protein [Salmonella enterica subsp. enterica serovar Muenchen]EBS2730993.1 hypothetical prot